MPSPCAVLYGSYLIGEFIVRMATPSKGTGVKPTESNGRTKVPGTHSTTASEESMEMEETLMTDKTNAAAPPDADHVKVGQATQMMPRDIGARPKVRMTRRPKKEAQATQAGLSLGDRKLIKQCLGCKWEGKSLRTICFPLFFASDTFQ